LIRPEATGYGDIYFAENMLAVKGDTLEGKTCVISGSGNVASFAAEKLMQRGAKVVTLSDRSGTLYVKEGFTPKLLKQVMNLKNVKRGELSELAKAGKFVKGANPWQVADKVDCAFPCSRQNELDGKDAEYLVKHGCNLVVEGANMPSTPEAVDCFLKAGILYAPGKAANAGGVATSGLEMSQNSERMLWSAETVDAKLREIMAAIHDNAYKAAEKYGYKGNYVMGANIAGFTKVADAMLAQGF
ncbi:MAG: NADP-specific glutamate dehydrogenase, partial [Victivallales bacterium]|nr:NADP-specific glutamate dehydrogenase [Victivallales bacterium]